MKKVSVENKYKLSRSIIVLLVYLLYTIVFDSISGMFNMTNKIIVSFIADVCFLAFVLAMYKDKLITDINAFHQKTKFSTRVLVVGGWVLIILAANILGSFSGSLIANVKQTDNNLALFMLPYIYTFFKTLIFSSIAEELVFKQSLRDVIDNNIIFIVVSTILYATMNIAYTDLEGLAILANMLPYALFAVVTGILYLKYKDNIYVVMTVKVCYNIIPFVILLLGGVG